MRLHAEITMVGGDADTLRGKLAKWLIISLAGFLFWAAMIAAVRQVI